MNLNAYIDHTLLKPDATKQDICRLCEEAKLHSFAAICINPFWILHAKPLLQDSPVKLCSVVGFPLGANTGDTKAQEAEQLAAWGVHEIDMVIHIGALKSQEYALVQNDISAVVKAANPAIVKVIIETCLLSDEEKKIACALAVEAGAAFVKTSTGFSKGGATLHDVALMRSAVGPHIGVKASGGIAERSFALQLIAAGATRLGTSKSITLSRC